ncbi:1-acyl-sn-glycerol-3-phosphate acyltransferase [Spirochaeta isovalerica]|uniref:Glycerol-3-phosphate O-acyltransferase n=1 Tax=Spirochaeta isovalerica TaxID=150 RepID=A0A841RB05_9SPIO|nr:1-acyl-sn-glycerol-3-phosphate acyltransferase [Spirochaeta isovalerica]MBB6481135.1 glycerol-3-phosphate O-acyltransferase [Spirochaeta isovalerica]
MSDYYNQLKTVFSILQTKLDGDYEIRPDNVYQEGNHECQALIGSLVDKIVLPGSRIIGSENIRDLYERSRQGESCLLLVEHYSNFDYPVIFRFLENDPLLGQDVARSLIPIQGMKLSDEEWVTSAFTHSYATIVIYPSRSIDNVKDPDKKAEIRKVSTPINHAAMRELTDRKYHGQMILVFPSGTRYRPWDPESKKGVREIFTYLKSFENILFLGINGNIMKPHQSDDMNADIKAIEEDLIILTASPVIKGKEFRKEVIAKTPEGEDSKQFVVDQVMAELDRIHRNTEKIREKELAG